MKYLSQVILTLTFTTACLSSFSQDITDTRRKTESFKKLHPPEVRADVASFTFAGISESAQAPELKKISPDIITADSMVIRGDGLYARVLLEPFDPKAHKIIYDDEAEKIPIKIDRRTYYGDYGSMPRTTVGSIIFVDGGDTIPIPPAAYSDLMNMHFGYMSSGVARTRNGLFISKDGKRKYLYLFSRGSRSGYEVTFIFQDKQYLRRVIDYDLL